MKKILFPLYIQYKPAYNYLQVRRELDRYLQVHHFRVTPVKLIFSPLPENLAEAVINTEINYPLPASIPLSSILEINHISSSESRLAMVRIITRELHAFYFTGIPGRHACLQLTPEEIRYHLLLPFYWKARHRISRLFHFIRHLPESQLTIEE